MSSSLGLTASSSQPSGRTFLSRLVIPFSSRTRLFTEFYIDPAEPHRRYAPGDLVEGKVIIKLTKPMRITHLVLCLLGYVKVFKNRSALGEITAEENGYIDSGKGKRSSEHFGNGFALLFREEVTLCGEGRLEAGSFEIPYAVRFPTKELPTSIDVSSTCSLLSASGLLLIIN